jgi:hypothetical protein
MVRDGLKMSTVLYLYLFAAVAGSLLVLVSLAGGGHHDDGGGDAALDAGHGDAHALGDGHGDAHADAPALDAGHGALVAGTSHALHAADAATGTPAAHPSGDGSSSGVPTAVMWLLSVQLWTYFLAFGGVTGLLLRTIARVAEPIAGLTALGVGLTTALGARALLRRAAEPGDPGTTQLDRLVGTSARVLIPAPAGATGKIRLEVRGQTVDLMARSTDGAALTEGAEVIVLDVREGVAEVTTDSPAVPPVRSRAALAASSPQASSGPASGKAS